MYSIVSKYFLFFISNSETWKNNFLKLKLNNVDVVGEKYSGVFKSLSPRSKNVGDWFSVREGMLVLKADFFFLPFLVICS